MKRVAVIGGGGTGITMAADLERRGVPVTLCDLPGHFQALEDLTHRDNRVRMTGAFEQTVHISEVTPDLRRALEQAEVILVAVVAQRHEALADELAPLLRDGQTVCFSAGNCASLLLKRRLRGREVVVGEMQGNSFPCRLTGVGEVHIAFPYKPKKAAAFPARDTPALLQALEGIYACTGARNVFEAALNSPNVSVHLAASVLNISKMESQPEFRLYRDGLTPSAMALIAAAEAEKAAVLEAMGYACDRALGQIEALLAPDLPPELERFRNLSGPDGVRHRYFTEDALAGNSLLSSLGKRAGVPTPVCDGLIALVSAINQTPYYRQGRTLEQFGLSGLTPEEINRYLYSGAPAEGSDAPNV